MPEDPIKTRERRRRYKRAHPEVGRRHFLSYYQRNHDKLRLLARIRHRALRDEVFHAYGDACACCGEFDPAFLSVDHVNGGGKRHLMQIGGTGSLYRWLRSNGYPKGDFQLLCFNCNLGRAHNDGICPHVAEPAEE